MLPGFAFRFIACCYLPGLPLSISIFYLVKPDRIVVNFNWYMIISPIIIGLFLDGIRHSFKLLNREAFLFCKDIKPESIKGFEKEYGQAYTNDLLANATTYFHVYEFFFNFGLSCVITLLLMNSYHERICWDGYFHAVDIALGLSIFFAATFKLERDKIVKLIEDTNKVEKTINQQGKPTDPGATGAGNQKQSEETPEEGEAPE